MALHGSSVPLDHGGFAVMVICPNQFSYWRLMQALNGIVPDAGQPTPQPETREQPTPYIAGFEPNEDGVIAFGCRSGVCDL